MNRLLHLSLQGVIFVILALPLVVSGRVPFKPLHFQISTGVGSQEVFLASELYGWNPKILAMKETSLGNYVLDIPEPWTPRLQYKFVINGQWVTDPANPNQVPDGHGGYNSISHLSFKEDPMLFQTSTTPPVKRTTLSLIDLEGSPRQVFVTMPDISLNGRSVVTVYFQDGKDYLQQAAAETLIANLATLSNMPVIVGVFIPAKEGAREHDYGNLTPQNRYVDFLADVVVPAVEKRTQIVGAPQKRLLIGPSLGGLITVYTALRRSDVFNLAASQSGSFWYPHGEIISMLGQARGKNLKLLFDVGLFEIYDKMILENRLAYNAARSAGIPVLYSEIPTGHDWLSWRNCLGPILKAFFQTRGR